MDQFAENLAHFTHGMAFMAFLAGIAFLYTGRRQDRLIQFLRLEMILWSLVYLKDTLYLIPGVWYNDYISAIQILSDMWCVPATILLLFEIVSPGWVTWPRGVVLAAPSVAVAAVYAVFPSGALFFWALIYTLILGVAAVAAVFLASSRYDNFIKRNFSSIEDMSLRWMRRVITLLFGLLIIWTFETTFTSWLNDALYYLLAIGVWAAIFYFTYRHKVVEVPDYINPFAGGEEGIPVQDGKFPFETKLLNAMAEKKLYLNPQLTVADLAGAIGTNRSYLSEHINRTVGTNFYDYVNDFRIREACALLEQENTGITVEGIAQRSGFNSFSTFRRAFHARMGVTPAQYRKTKGGF